LTLELWNVRPCEFVPLPIAPGNCAMHADNYRRTGEGGISRGRLLPDSVRRAATPRAEIREVFRWNLEVDLLTVRERKRSGRVDAAAPGLEYVFGPARLFARLPEAPSRLPHVRLGPGLCATASVPSIRPAPITGSPARKISRKDRCGRPRTPGKQSAIHGPFPTICSRARRICIGKYAVCAAS
jgi:hypothetical protein